MPTGSRRRPSIAEAASGTDDHLDGFPTTIIVDRKGQVRRIHTGFSGPATGEHYERFVDEFTRSLEQLLAERSGGT